MRCPAHIDGFVLDASNAFPMDASECHQYHQIECSCEGQRFQIMLSDHGTLHAKCLACGRVIVVYDLSKYPCAFKGSGEEVFSVIDDGVNQQSVYVMYEYSESESDVESNDDDITWCQVFVESNGGKITKVFDDETC